MAVYEIQLNGANTLADRLSIIDKKVASGISKHALSEGAKVMQSAARQNAPVDTGLLKSSLKVRAARGGGRGVFAYSVYASTTKQRAYRKRYPKFIAAAKAAGKEFKANQQWDVFYAKFIEWGFKRGSRKLRRATAKAEKKGVDVLGRRYKRMVNVAWDDARKDVPARPFLGPAFDANVDGVVAMIMAEIGAELDKLT